MIETSDEWCRRHFKVNKYRENVSIIKAPSDLKSHLQTSFIVDIGASDFPFFNLTSR